MTKPRSKKETRKLIRSYTEKWKGLLWLREWDTHNRYVIGTLSVNGEPDERAAACTTVRWQYRSACIDYRIDSLLDVVPEELERIVAHELLHAVIAEMREWTSGDAMKHEERVVTWLAEAFMDANRAITGLHEENAKLHEAALAAQAAAV